MSIETVQLYPDDDINSMRDRLDWVKSERVLFVLPDEADLLTDETDLALLARHTDGLRIQLGLVTQQPAVRQKASSFGFPTFFTEDLAADSGREWRRNRIRPEGSGYTAAELADVYEDVASRRLTEIEISQRPEWQSWAKYAVILVLGAVVLTFFIAGIGFVVPSATVTFTPERRKITVQKEITADPAADSAGLDNTGSTVIGGRNLAMQIQWQSDAVPTGQVELGANPSRGKIVFVNLTEDGLVIPAGILLRTADDPPIQFQTVVAAQLPAAVGGTVEVDIAALEVGPQGNLPADSLVLTEGNWGTLVEARQPLPTSGGDIQPVPVVTEADRLALRTEVIQQLQSIGASEVESTLGSNEFLSVESVQINQILSESWSHQIGEKSERLSLTIDAELGGIIIDFNQATDLVYTDLVGSVEPGFSLTPDSFRFYTAGTTRVNPSGQVVFDMVGEGTMTAVSDTSAVLEQLAGKDEAEAIEILQVQLNLENEPVIRVIPNWFGRMPNLASRIEFVESGK